MLLIKIDRKIVKLPIGISIIEACELIGVTIPRYCYHEMLSVSGNCRMCVVEIDTIDKPVASCVTEIKENMQIFTNNPFVKKARENILEHLLLNHPLDCPICDQAGECDLQDHAKTFGFAHSRVFFSKKSVEKKQGNPILKLIMMRCIACTRCTRFDDEIALANAFGTINRGRSTEISSFAKLPIISPLSGTFVDLCPVGAITNNIYSFKARPWELQTINSIDITDSMGSNIIIQLKGQQIYRILSKINKLINNSLLKDSARFLYENIVESINKNTDTFDNKLYYFKNKNFFLTNKFNANILHIIQQMQNFRNDYLLNINQKNETNFYKTQIKAIHNSLKYAKEIYIVGCDTNNETPILSNKLKKFNEIYSLKLLNIGFNHINTKHIKNISFKTTYMFNILKANLNSFKKFIKKSNKFINFAEPIKNSIGNFNIFPKNFEKINKNNIYTNLTKFINQEFNITYKHNFYKKFVYKKMKKLYSFNYYIFNQDGLFANVEHRIQKTNIIKI